VTVFRPDSDDEYGVHPISSYATRSIARRNATCCTSTWLHQLTRSDKNRFRCGLSYLGYRTPSRFKLPSRSKTPRRSYSKW
ncbi:imidazolonepropionase, partial [Vibrio parahaemolyticus V-223/04]